MKFIYGIVIGCLIEDGDIKVQFIYGMAIGGIIEDGVLKPILF